MIIRVHKRHWKERSMFLRYRSGTVQLALISCQATAILWKKRVIKLFCLVIRSTYRKNDSVTVIIHPATINVRSTTGICLNPFVLKKVVLHREESYTCSTSLMHEILLDYHRKNQNTPAVQC